MILIIQREISLIIYDKSLLRKHRDAKPEPPLFGATVFGSKIFINYVQIPQKAFTLFQWVFFSKKNLMATKHYIKKTPCSISNFNSA